MKLAKIAVSTLLLAALVGTEAGPYIYTIPHPSCGAIDSTGLTAWWTLDDTTGADSSGNGHTLTFNGTGYSAATGVITNQITFASTGWSSFTTITTPSDNWTVSFWVTPTSADTAASFIGLLNNSGGTGIWLENGVIYLNSSASTATLAAGQTYNVVLINTAGTVAFYTNGVACGTAGGFAGTFSFGFLGSWSSGNDALHGSMDDVYIYGNVAKAGGFPSTVYSTGSTGISIPGWGCPY